MAIRMLACACATVAVCGLAAASAPSADEVRARRPSAGGGAPEGPGPFVNWENPHVSPIAMTPDGSKLLVVNTPDNRLEVFDLTGGSPKLSYSVPVGLDPVSVRARTNTEVWVVNHVSDSVSIVSLVTRHVVNTVKTADEPADVVFAGTPQRAFVSCSQVNKVQVFDPANLAAAPSVVDVFGEDPRAMAVSPDGSKVYVAIFESGNGSTVLGGGGSATLGFPPNVVNHPAGPYGGVNPPPNSGAAFSPPIAPTAANPPRVGLIVRKDAAGQWKDDNNGNWTNLVSGPQASLSGRPVGWDLPDHDIAIIDASSLSLSYANRLMTMCMALGVNPANGRITLVGTEALNQVRFEPVVNGRFIRVNLAMVEAANPAAATIKDLNPHLNYTGPTLPSQAEREKGLGDPRGIVWNSAGTRGYVTGMGSNNVVVIDANGNRAGLTDTIAVGEGPTGVVLDEARQRLYVLNKFASTVSVVSTLSETEVAEIAFYDPSPAAIKIGRKHLYNTHLTSGLGITSCASCHVDARFDRLAWDLGDPQGTSKSLAGLNLGAGIPGLSPGTTVPAFAPFHPMKGPMTTQTLQGIVGLEPHHWRGDRLGLEEFNPAFVGLLGDTQQLTPAQMQEFESFIGTITFPPNPFRNFDNTLPTNLPLPGHFTTGVFSPAGQPLPNGNAVAGMNLYRDTARRLDGGAFACVTCHTLPTGAGPDAQFSAGQFTPIPPGPLGQRHIQVVSVDGSTNITIKTPHLRNMHEKAGFNTTQLQNTSGFGVLHDGSVDSLERFVTEPVFTTATDQETANLVAFLLSFAGSELPAGSPTNILIPPGPPSQDTHAAVGQQTTLVNEATAPPAQLVLIGNMVSLAVSDKTGLVVKGRVNGRPRGFAYMPGTGNLQSDRAGEVYSINQLRSLAQAGGELTYTVVPRLTQVRIGIDRDNDGIFDGDEAGGLGCYANCDASAPAGQPTLTIADFGCFQSKFVAADPYADCTQDGNLSVADFACFQSAFAAGCP